MYDDLDKCAKVEDDMSHTLDEASYKVTCTQYHETVVDDPCQEQKFSDEGFMPLDLHACLIPTGWRRIRDTGGYIQ